MNVTCAHTTGIQRDYLFFNPGNISLIFRNQLQFKLPITVSWYINLKFTVLAFLSSLWNDHFFYCLSADLPYDFFS